jgi:hypothetical protein
MQRSKLLPCCFLVIFSFLAIVVAQTLPTCVPGEPKCYSDLIPYAGHGPASGLPSSLCSNCSGDNRRVVVVRISSSWDASPGVTNANIFNATNCAISQWNNATETNGSHTGYYLVLDQQNATGVSQADITIIWSINARKRFCI